MGQYTWRGMVYGRNIQAVRHPNTSHATINGTGEKTLFNMCRQDTVSALLLIAEKGMRDEYAICAKEAYSLE